MLSGRISRNIGENIFRSYTGSTSENTDFHVLVALVNCACLTTRWKYDVIYLTFLALDVILSFGTPRMMGAIESLGCNWWSNMHQIDA